MPYLLLFFFSLVFYNHALAVTSQTNNLNDPIEIFSDTLHYFPKENRAVFEGKVEASQKDLHMRCKIMTVLFAGKTPAQTSDDHLPEDSKIKQIFLEGDVVIISPKERAEARRGEYVVETGVATLFDDVRLYQGESKLFGDKLVHNKNTGESLMTMTNHNKRVKGVFAPEDKQDGK